MNHTAISSHAEQPQLINIIIAIRDRIDWANMVQPRKDPGTLSIKSKRSFAQLITGLLLVFFVCSSILIFRVDPDGSHEAHKEEADANDV